MALAQHLAFGFPLGRRTLFQNIQALPPASLITIDLQRSRVSLELLHQHNLDHRQPASPNTTDNAALLAELFQDACHSRISTAGMNVVSLSGGLDSRAVAACIPQENRRVAAATFLDHEGSHAPDFQTARQVASHLHLPWYPFQLAPPRSQEVQTLLQLKQGANNLEMSFILAFFGGLLKTFGPDLTYFTGDGGGDTLGESRPYRRLASPAALKNYLIERYQVFPLKTAAALTRVPAGELLADLDDVLASYPEATPARKYQHFFCLEVAVKQYNHGEDRNRQYFWSVSPFYAPRFFTCAMSCPDRQKRGLRLYQKFLEILSPGLASIPYADWGAPLGSLKFTVLHAAKNLSRRHPEITRRIRRFLHSPNHEAQQFFPSQALKKQLVAVNGLAGYFSEAALMGLASKVDTLTMAQRWNLFTLTSLGRGPRPHPRHPTASLVSGHGAHLKMPSLAYFFSAFPVLTETLTLQQVQATGKLGLSQVLAANRRPAPGREHAASRDLSRKTFYLTPVRPGAVCPGQRRRGHAPSPALHPGPRPRLAPL